MENFLIFLPLSFPSVSHCERSFWPKVLLCNILEQQDHAKKSLGVYLVTSKHLLYDTPEVLSVRNLPRNILLVRTSYVLEVNDL